MRVRAGKRNSNSNNRFYESTGGVSALAFLLLN